MNFFIKLEQARKVVRMLEPAVARGFVASECVLKAVKMDESAWVELEADTVCYRGNPNDPHTNWGANGLRMEMEHKFVDGKLLPLDDKEKDTEPLIGDGIYQKRYVKHVGFGDGDDGWEILKVNAEDEDDDLIAQVQTETLADAIINYAMILDGLKRAIAALNHKVSFRLPGGGTSYELLADLGRLVKGAT